MFGAYRRDWEPVLGFLTSRGFAVTREVINLWAEPDRTAHACGSRKNADKPPRRADLPAVVAMGRGILRLPESELESYFFANPYFPVEAFLVQRATDGTPTAMAIGLENSLYADVKKVDPLAPCFRLGAFGSEGLNAKRINGLFSFLVANPANAITAGLALLHEASEEMTDGTVTALAAQCPSDAPHLARLLLAVLSRTRPFPCA